MEYGYQNGDGGYDAGQGGSEQSSVFITSLQWWTTDAELEQLCAAYGQVVSIKFIEDRANGKSRGMAVVEFANPESVQHCINGLSGTDINGRQCKVAQQQNRGGPGRGMGGPMQGGRGMGMGMHGPGRGMMGGPPMMGNMPPPWAQQGGMPPPPMMGGPPPHMGGGYRPQ